MTQSTDHPNAQCVRSYLEAFGRHDLEAAASHFHDDIVWRVGGDHPLSREYRGREAVLGYLQKASELTGGTLRVEPESALASDTKAALFVRVTGERDGRSLDADMTQIVRTDEDGKWFEYWALSSKQPTIDEFWA